MSGIMTGKTICRELADAVAGTELDEGAQARRARHLEHCTTCAARAHLRAAVREAVLAEDDQLDDLTRSRVLGRLGETIDPVATARSRWGTRAPRRLAWSLGLVAAVAVVVGLGLSLAQRIATSPASAVVAARPGRVLTPYAVQAADEPARPELGKALDRLQLPARATVRAHLGELAELTLVGPLDLSVTHASPQVVELRLGRGTLVGDYDGIHGGKLRVRSGAVTVEVVGTLFAVEASQEDTRVSVVHGTVRIECQGQVVMLTNGQSWSASRNQVEPFAPSVSLLFERVGRGLVDEPASGVQAQAPPGPAPAAAGAAGASLPEPTSPRARPAMATHLARHASEGRTGPAVVPAVSEGPLVLPSAAGHTATGTPLAWPAPSPAAAPMPGSSAAPSPAPAAPVTAASLYRQAEAALQHGDDARGRQLLSELVLRFPTDASADAARFELALILRKAGQRQQALALADHLARSGRDGPFLEPARFLRCRLDADKGAATECLQQFVDEYPRSSHHAQALQMLIELHLGARHCARATELARTYLAAHPHGDFAAQAEKVGADCAK